MRAMFKEREAAGKHWKQLNFTINTTLVGPQKTTIDIRELTFVD